MDHIRLGEDAAAAGEARGMLGAQGEFAEFLDAEAEPVGQLYAVTVQVGWESSGSRRSISMTTLLNDYGEPEASPQSTPKF
jgi:hypothetical protein